MKSLLEVQSVLIELLNKPTVNPFGILRSTMEPQQNQAFQLLTFKTNLDTKMPMNLLDFGKIYKLI